MDIRVPIKEKIEYALSVFGIEDADAELEHPSDLSHGDYSTNVALVYGKQLGKNPREFAEELTYYSLEGLTNEVERVEIAGPGFINFYLAPLFISNSVRYIYEQEDRFGTNSAYKGKRIMVEYTDPNPFKELHAGHLMNNTLGESVSRLIFFGGADLIRACYQGDVGPHVAKALWGMKYSSEDRPEESASLTERVAFLGRSYVAGNTAYEESEEAKAEIDSINKAIYEESDAELMDLYAWGRSVSLEHFEEIYEKLNTSFDTYYFESKTAKRGRDIVAEGSQKGVFEESEGAVVFKGERYGLHTRVFMNSLGLPTYETKELGLNVEKFENENLDLSIVVTANEQNAYFEVVLKALSLLYPDVAERTLHVPHGMLRTPEGKMSSRKGNVIGGGMLLEDIEENALKKVREGGRFDSEEEERRTAEVIAVAALRYAILKQTPGKNTVFDMERSLSLEGDSGPYLQYAATRAASAAEAAKKAGIGAKTVPESPFMTDLERLLYRFPEIVERSQKEYAPHYIATYLTSLASAFNGFYATERIADPDDPHAGYKLLLTESFRAVMKNGLYLLGIEVPERM